MRTKAEVLGELRTMLRDIFIAKAQGETHARLARAHGYVDGYMRALLETGTTTKQELLEIVAGERERVSGPAMRPLSGVSEIDSEASDAKPVAARNSDVVPADASAPASDTKIAAA